jgi:hypothetical protein
MKMRPLVFGFGRSTRFAFPLALLVIASGCYGTPRSDLPTGARGGTAGGGTAGGDSGGVGGLAGAGGVGDCSAMLETDSKNCGACGHDCLGGMCERSTCKPVKLADIPQESVRTIGLAPDYVLVSGTRSGAPIYTVSKQSGVVARTRPPRVDGSYSSRLVGTRSTLVAADVYTPGVALYYLSHCAIADCGTTSPAAGSNTFDGIRDFAFDAVRGRVFWFDLMSNELVSTSADAWSPVSAGPASVAGQTVCRGMAQGNGRVFGAFDFGVIAIPEDGSSTPVAVSGVPLEMSVAEIAVSPESLIILGHLGALYTAPLPAGIGNNLPDLVPSVSGVTTIATSGSTLLWSGISTIYRCDLPLCARPVPIAQDLSVVRDIIADDKAVYWLSQPDVTDPTSSVMRLAV